LSVTKGNKIDKSGKIDKIMAQFPRNIGVIVLILKKTDNLQEICCYLEK
jgi:hypothetical protein